MFFKFQPEEISFSIFLSALDEFSKFFLVSKCQLLAHLRTMVLLVLQLLVNSLLFLQHRLSSRAHGHGTESWFLVFVEDFCVSIDKIYGPVVFFSFSVFVWF